MKVQELFEFLQEIVPHEFGEKTLCRWLNEVEGKVQTQVLLLQDEDLTQYVWPDNRETELLAKFPHDDIYWTYLAAMVAYAHGETQEYNNHITLFNERFAAYSCWYADQYRPADGKMTERLYYLTAYAIAKAHGFVGTEEEWLASLHGEDGVDGKDGRDGVDGKNGVDGKDGDENVFIAVYGETTWTEINEAFLADKVLFCRDGNTRFWLYNKAANGSFWFRTVSRDGVTLGRTCHNSGTWEVAAMNEKYRPDRMEPRITALESAGGDGFWEIIETITLEEDTASIVRSKTPQGAAYAFAALGAFVSIAKSSQDRYLCLAHRFHDDDGWGREVYQRIDGGGDGNRTYYVWTNAEAGTFGRCYITSVFDDGSGTGDGRTITAAINLISKPVTMFELYECESAEMIPAGSRITIFGLREDAII